MATYKRIDMTNIDVPYDYKIFNKSSPNSSNGLTKTAVWYKVDGSITNEDVKRINQSFSNVVLILDNTKGQNSEIIKQLDSSKVRLSVLGGLDYFKKKKFNVDNYILRTINSPVILSKVIEFFEKIERSIKYTWTDEQKCMYVYKVLVEKLHYKYKNESEFEDGKNVVRMLQGVLYGKLVCAGFALVFKEAMDRLGIPCLYQNKQHHHSWNIIRLNGKNYGLDITWDCSSKEQNNQCKFAYFGRDKDFYRDKHHDIFGENEEQKVGLSAFDFDELCKDLTVITKKGNVTKGSLDVVYDCLGNKVNYYKWNKLYLIKTDKYFTITLLEKDLIASLKTNSIDSVLRKSSMENKINFKRYVRRDGSEFLISDEKKTKNGVREYSYIDIIDNRNSLAFRKGIILSEMDLCRPIDDKTNRFIADDLLSKKRLTRKINYYNGYVGYISREYIMYYDESFEKEELGIQVRK